MTTCSFDQLLYALRVSVEAANEALLRRRTAQYEAGDASGQALHVDVPQGPGPDAPLEAVVIPLRWFRDPRVPQVTELSVEFDCRFRYERSRDGTGAMVIDMHPPRATWLRRRPLHRMRIRFRATEAWQPHVAIDGRAVSLPVARAG